MSDWPSEKEFTDALGSLLRERVPTQVKIVSIAKIALDNARYYKHVVKAVEKFVAKIVERSPGHLLGAAYVIDAICRRSQAKNGASDKFGPRFAAHIDETIAMLRRCPEGDRISLDRVLGLWKENSVIVDSGPQSEHGAVSKRSRVPSPRTPPGNPPSSNRIPAPRATQTEGLPPMMGSMPPPMFMPPPPVSNVAPPMLPPPMMGPPSQFPPPMGGGFPLPGVRVSSGPPPPPVVINMDFDYDDDVPIATEEAISDAKRRRLEQERRANEQVNLVEDTVRRLEPLIEEPEKLFATLQAENLTIDGVIGLLRPHAGTKELVAKLSAISARRRDIMPLGEENPLDDPGLEQEINGITYIVKMSTTVYVGNVRNDTTEADIRSVFGPFGTIATISHIPQKGVSFVTFANRSDAETAQHTVKGQMLNGQALKTAWARGPGMNRQGDFDTYTGRELVPKDPEAYARYLAANPDAGRGRGRGRGRGSGGSDGGPPHEGGRGRGFSNQFEGRGRDDDRERNSGGRGRDDDRERNLGGHNRDDRDRNRDRDSYQRRDTSGGRYDPAAGSRSDQRDGRRQDY